jgi:hypothetical protein
MSAFLVRRYFEDYGEDRLLIDSTKRLSAEQQLEVRHADRCRSLRLLSRRLGKGDWAKVANAVSEGWRD